MPKRQKVENMALMQDILKPHLGKSFLITLITGVGIESCISFLKAGDHPLTDDSNR